MKWTKNWQQNTANLFPLGQVVSDGQAELTVACRFGKLKLARRMMYDKEVKKHTMPGNAVLPVHEGMVVTRGLQEWACLLPGELPFSSAARLLGWQTNEDAILSDTTLRTLVKKHGSLIREAEAAEVEALWQQSNLLDMQPVLVTNQPVRLRASWPTELNDAVEAALVAGSERAPEGVSPADWARVLVRHKQDQTLSASQLRRLGPEVKENELLVTTDEVLTRKPQKRRFWELRTAKVVTTQGYRYLGGVGDSFLNQLFLMLLILGLGRHRSCLLLADGARWIRNFYTDRLAQAAKVQMILDWYHLRKKGYQLSSMICRGKVAKTHFLATLFAHLWSGEVTQAVTFLEDYRLQAKNLEKLDELIAYLLAREAFIPNYRDRRCQREYIGSGHAEKANDLIVARRQKKKGMHWSLDTSDALAALKTLLLNGGWDLYWSERKVLPLAVPT